MVDFDFENDGWVAWSPCKMWRTSRAKELFELAKFRFWRLFQAWQDIDLSQIKESSKYAAWATEKEVKDLVC